MANDIETLAEGKYLGLYKRGPWEYVERPNDMGVVAILPITDDQKIVFIEQFRIPIQARVIEIPAGLSGDDPRYAAESLKETAARELMEETGYHAEKITELLSSPTSAGMTSEFTHFFAATQLARLSKGGGIEGEEITAHHVEISELDRWLSIKKQEGYMIDFKIYACLYLALQHGLIQY